LRQAAPWMTGEDRVRYGAALGILLLWAGVVVFGDHDTVNAVTPAAIGAATFLFASPAFFKRKDERRHDDKDDDER
jgi:hypothetical protein